MEDIVRRLQKRAEIRRQIPTRKSVQNNEPDRIADLLEECANEIIKLRKGWKPISESREPGMYLVLFDPARLGDLDEAFPYYVGYVLWTGQCWDQSNDHIGDEKTVLCWMEIPEIPSEYLL